MEIQQITKTTPKCFGVMCKEHMHCARYQEIDGSKPGEHRIYMCSETDERPLFVELVREEA